MALNHNVAPSKSTTSANDAYAIRIQYRRHEGIVRAIGFLFILEAIFLLPLGVFVILRGLAEQSVSQRNLAFTLGAVFMIHGIAHGASGMGLRRLQSWARVVALVLSVLGLIAAPIGTLIYAYVMYILLSKKGVYVFSDEYRRLMDETRQIQPTTSITMIILIFVLIVVNLFGFIAMLVLD